MASDEIALNEYAPDPRIERIVWQGLGRKSVRQIAEEAGISPEMVLRVKRDLMDSIDVLTIQEKRAKLLADLQDIAQRTQDDYDLAPMEFKASLMSSATQAIKTVMNEMRAAEKADNTKVEALNQLRVRALVRIMQATVDEGVREVAERYDLDAADLLEIFNRNLALAAEAEEARLS